MVQYLWAPSSLFSWSWLLKKKKEKGVSQHPLSRWINITVYSIPEAYMLVLCSLSFQAAMLISFALALWGDEDVMLHLLYCSVRVDVVVVFAQESPGKKKKNNNNNKREQADPRHFLSLETGRGYCRHSLSFNPSVDVCRSAHGSRQYGYTNLQSGGLFLLGTNITGFGK